jgi:Na+/phosphate symporter
MELFTIQKYHLHDSYTINIQINFIGITNAFNTLMAIYFSRAFTKAVETNIQDFHDSSYAKADLFFLDQNLSHKFEISTNDEQLHQAYLDMLKKLKNTNVYLLEAVKGLYTKDGNKMKDYLTKYISHYFLSMELEKANNNTKEETKKLKV